jgi:hypothetical protein
MSKIEISANVRTIADPGDLSSKSFEAETAALAEA